MTFEIKNITTIILLMMIGGCSAKERLMADWKTLEKELSIAITDHPMTSFSEKLRAVLQSYGLNPQSQAVEDMLRMGSTPLIQLAAYSLLDGEEEMRKMQAALRIAVSSTSIASPIFADLIRDLANWSRVNPQFPHLLSQVLAADNAKEDNLAFLVSIIDIESIKQLYLGNMLNKIPVAREVWLLEMLQDANALEEAKIRENIRPRLGEFKKTPGRPRIVYTILFASDTERQELLPLLLIDSSVDPIGIRVVCSSFRDEVKKLINSQAITLDSDRRNLIIQVLAGIEKQRPKR
jgi:hypothetical protein